VYDKDLSDSNTAVWHNPKTNESHVSNRGSVSAHDWVISDTQLALGQEKRGARFKKAVDTARRARDKYKGTVSTSGHSLGGRASSYTTEQLGNEDWYVGGKAYNPGNSSLGADGLFSKSRRDCKKKNPPAYCTKQTTIKEKGDYVSAKNVVCDYLTFGYGNCTKTQAFGKTKLYDHRKSKRWHSAISRLFPPARYISNLQTHSLDSFASR
jgi:hypothetical protein